MVFSIPLFDCTEKSLGDLQRAQSIIHAVQIPETPGAGQHQIPAAVGQVPTAWGKGISYKYL